MYGHLALSAESLGCNRAWKKPDTLPAFVPLLVTHFKHFSLACHSSISLLFRIAQVFMAEVFTQPSSTLYVSFGVVQSRNRDNTMWPWEINQMVWLANYEQQLLEGIVLVNNLQVSHRVKCRHKPFISQFWIANKSTKIKTSLCIILEQKRGINSLNKRL